ncbi:DUF397 domain-containing protein [Streptomyces sp. NPDC059454]|uniref:DUF397 domain-containing protein n=1 Tax=Streptomyces sp. NPDC059454 TaxID=3346836 RepID=UPI003679C23B
MNDQPTWFKSSYRDSEGGNCVEVAVTDAVHIRDSKNPTGPGLHVTAPAWSAFVAAARPS